MSSPGTPPAGDVAAGLMQLSSLCETIADESTLEGYEVDGLRPHLVAWPGSATEVASLVEHAAARRLAVIPCGGRSKLATGAPPARYELALDLSRLSRVLAYDPRDLTLGVEPGITFAALSDILAAEDQFLPLAPPFADRATIGGIISANSASPLRQAYGGPRDFVLGMEFVTGNGAAAKSGGRVVKNVSGYDLHKLLIGSLGTLAVITRVNFKTFPRPPAQGAFIVGFGSFAESHAFCQAIVKSPLAPVAIEAISPEALPLLNLSRDQNAAFKVRGWSVLVLAAGNEAVVARHARDLQALAEQAEASSFTVHAAPEAAALLAASAEFPRLAHQGHAAVFRISALSGSMCELVQQICGIAQRAHLVCAVLARPHGLVYAALFGEGSPGFAADWSDRFASAAPEIFRVLTERGARGFVEFAPLAWKHGGSVWGVEREDLELMRRVKGVFDPENILSPGRFVGGI